MLAQSIAKHLRVPGLVLLLVFGVLLGPDVANLVQPATLGEGLSALVGCAVAVILFEGGMTLDIRHLRRRGRAINQLISVGALVSLVVGGIVAAIVMGFGWKRSLLFGTLVIVTGPTVVTPLLRQLRVSKSVSTVLEAEGVLIDAVGAITAAVALELVLSPSGQSVALALPTIAWRLVFGVIVGLVGGLVLAGLLRFRGVIPEGLTNTFTLGWALLVFQIANAVLHESGIAAVTIAGLVVGNVHTHDHRSLHEFKEQLTVMLIALLFVLLVADVRVADVQALGVRGGLVAGATILVIRPLSVLAGTFGTSLTKKERIFVAWIGPRGIVAAAVASLFAFQLERAHVEGGTELRALVFLVIAVTVFWSALTGGLAARALGLRRKQGEGWMVVGANALARAMAGELKRAGADVVCVEEDPDSVRAAEESGLRVLQRDALDPKTIELAQLDTRIGAIGLLTREEANYLFGEKSRLAVRTVRYPLAITSSDRGVTPSMVHDFGGELLFGRAVDVETWAKRVERSEVEIVWWRFRGRGRPEQLLINGRNEYLPLVHRRKSHIEPHTDRSSIRRKSEVALLMEPSRIAALTDVFVAGGWERMDRPESDDGEKA
ncbi:MAG: sodium:proton antiporter [Sandaracinaceae bacterium]|nr:sodium:proton antiporter [Sandaracinaceae bacterium]